MSQDDSEHQPPDPAVHTDELVLPLERVERLLFDTLPRLLSATSPVMLGGMGTFTLASTLLGDLASEDECRIIVCGLPNNPTTEMNLAL